MTDRLHCHACGKSVSTEFDPVPTDTPDKGLIVRAWIECPECIEKHGAETADTDALRETLDQLLHDGGDLHGDLIEAIWPHVKRAIQQSAWETVRAVGPEIKHMYDDVLAEKDARIAALQQQLQETRESFDAVVRAAGPFMPAVPVAVEGFDCESCGHRHSGQALAYICIGCACRETPAPPET
jgi:hypothetical protein